jgi:uncharacterized membrane protein YgcG
MECDDRCFASALLGLGQRGYLKIWEESGAYQVKRTGHSLAQLLPGERAIAALAPAKGARAIGATYDPAVQEARAALDDELERHFGEKLFSRNRGSVLIGVVLAGATLAVMVSHHAEVPVIIAAGFVMLAALMVAANLLPAYTVEGRRLEDEIEGLRQYLSVAEKDDLARAKRPPRTPEEFAKFLPFAVALGVEKTWADEFAKVLGAAGLAAATAGYYSTSNDSSSSIFGGSGGFVDSIADMGRTISAASTLPGSSSGSSSSGGSSSGSSGGGSSGGGGGGGGGSGW